MNNVIRYIDVRMTFSHIDIWMIKVKTSNVSIIDLTVFNLFTIDSYIWVCFLLTDKCEVWPEIRFSEGKKNHFHDLLTNQQLSLLISYLLAFAHTNMATVSIS